MSAANIHLTAELKKIVEKLKVFADLRAELLDLNTRQRLPESMPLLAELDGIDHTLQMAVAVVTAYDAMLVAGSNEVAAVAAKPAPDANEKDTIIAAKDAEIAALKEELEKVQKQYRDATAILGLKQIQNEALQSTIDRQKYYIYAQEEKLTKKESELEAYRSGVEKLNADVAVVQARLADFSQLREIVTTLVSEVPATTSRFAALQKFISPVVWERAVRTEQSELAVKALGSGSVGVPIARVAPAEQLSLGLGDFDFGDHSDLLTGLDADVVFPDAAASPLSMLLTETTTTTMRTGMYYMPTNPAAAAANAATQQTMEGASSSSSSDAPPVRYDTLGRRIRDRKRTGPSASMPKAKRARQTTGS